MGLKKLIKNPSHKGAMEYHKIHHIEEYNLENKVVRLNVYSYANYEEYKDGADKMYSETFTVSGNNFKGTKKDCLMAENYAGLKLLPEFSDSVDM